MQAQDTRPAPHPGTSWKRAADIKVSDNIFVGQLDGKDIWAAVSQVTKKPKTTWLRLAIQDGGFCIGIQNVRPKHDDEFQVRT